MEPTLGVDEGVCNNKSFLSLNYTTLFYPSFLILLLWLLGPCLLAQKKQLLLQGHIQQANQQPLAATVQIEGSPIWTIADPSGYYSINVQEGQTLVFSHLGMQNEYIKLPNQVAGSSLSISITLHPLEETLTEVLVKPILDRDNLSAEFLALPPTQAQQLQQIAEENLPEATLAEMGKYLEYNATDNVQLLLDQKAVEWSQKGQLPPMNLWSPIFWAEVFRKKKGKQKRKEKLKNRERRMLDFLEGENP